MNLVKLQENVEKMLDGERKRRDIALKWLDEVTAILTLAGKDTWGAGVCYGWEPSNTVDVLWFDEKGNKKESGIYFRYHNHVGAEDVEIPGFYSNSKDLNYWGTPIEELKGACFWHSIQVIIDWIPQVAETLEKRDARRKDLLKKIKTEGQ